jgi:hypothetical protein
MANAEYPVLFDFRAVRMKGHRLSVLLVIENDLDLHFFVRKPAFEPLRYREQAFLYAARGHADCEALLLGTHSRKTPISQQIANTVWKNELMPIAHRLSEKDGNVSCGSGSTCWPAPSACPAAATHPTGRRMVNVEPFPSALSTSIFPPMRSTTCLTMERPRPVPPTSLERALSTR